MVSEKKAIDRLTDKKSKVSSHYFIKNNGEIIYLQRFSYHDASTPSEWSQCSRHAFEEDDSPIITPNRVETIEL